MSGIDGNTLLCLHFDGTNGSTSFPDDGPLGFTLTDVSNVTVATATPKFGSGAGNFDAASYLSVPANAAWNFGTGALTIDFWHKSTSLASLYYFLDMRDAGETAGTTIYVYVLADGSVHFGHGAVEAASAAGAITTSGYHHVACVYSGGTLTVYIDGTASGSTASDSTSIDCSAAAWKLGARHTAANFTNGLTDEFRFSNSARWTSNFTPPAAAYSSDAQVPYNRWAQLAPLMAH